jgi:hypothetical protein
VQCPWVSFCVVCSKGGVGREEVGLGVVILAASTLVMCPCCSEEVSLVRCQSCLCWANLQIPSQWNHRGASLPFSITFHSRGFSPLRRRFCVVSFGF